MKKTILSLLAIAILSITSAQVTNEATPRGWSLDLKNTAPAAVMPSFNMQAILDEDAITDLEIAKPLRFAKKFDVDLNIFNSGEWTVLQNGDRIWRLNVKSPGAKTINFLMDRYELPVGGELYLYNDDRSDKIGPYLHTENQEDGILGTWIIYGDNVWLEYYEPKNVVNQGRISISQVSHGYRGLGKAPNDIAKLNESGRCNVDVNCDPNVGSTNGFNWTTIRNNYRDSVARIIINGNFLCTGSIVNNTLSNGTPYFLTANHCLGNNISNGASSSYNASNWSFGFQWFATTGARCAVNQNTTGPLNPTNVISGAVLRANDNIADFALFQLNQTPPAAWNLYYAGWNTVLNSSTGQLGVHHPSGDIMKLSRNDQAATTTNFDFNGNAQTRMWLISNWDYGVTEGGSSGSCLLNTSGQIIGVLSGGSAACSGTTDNNGFDIYGRVETAWSSFTASNRQLKAWLDPNNSNVTSLNGAYAANLSVTSESLFELNVYPNPSNGTYTIALEEDASYVVYNLAGQVIKEGVFTNLTNDLNISTAANGVYFLKVTAGNASNTVKLIKE